MTFTDDLKRFSVKVETRTTDALVGIAQEAHRSIQVGSEITGAPGQPVDTGALRHSWQLRFPDATSAEISTNLVYAPFIEDGIVDVGSRRGNATGKTRQRLTLRSQVGGFHSVALTIAGLQRIVDVVTRRIAGGTT